jgi:hypothetical protein
LNLGVRYDYYGVPYLQSGMTVGLQGGPSSIFGVSGRSFANWMVPTPTIDTNLLTKQVFVGPNSPNPNQQVFNDDWNNFGPAVGFAWQLPWLGKGKTTIRGGYQISFIRIGRADTFSGVIANTIGTSYRNSFNGDTTKGITYMDIAHLSSYAPVPIPATAIPLAAIPLTSRSQSYTVFDQNLRDPYVQNLTMALVRNIGSKLTVDLRYVGTLTRKNLDTVNINSANFLKNGLKEAFDAARAGGESDLLNKLFNGVNFAGTGYGPVGTVYNGVLQTGAMHLRASSTTWSNLANGNYSALASTLSTANNVPSYTGNSGLGAIPTGVSGTILRHANSVPGQVGQFPENFIYTNPQFSSANITGNMNYNNYHSMQAQVTLRPTAGISFVNTYTWSRNLGLAGTYTNPLDRAADYGLLSGHRAHQLVSDGTFDLPFGKNRMVGCLLNFIARWTPFRPLEPSLSCAPDYADFHGSC